MATVRMARQDDLEAVRAVGHATWPPTYGPIRGEAYVEAGLARRWSEDAVRRGIDEPRSYVAEADGAVIGCAVVGELDGAPMIWKLYVRPEAQRTGAGRTLLEAVLAELPDGAEVVRLDHAEGNDRAHAFYVAQGFVETGRHGEDDDRQVRMERRLR